MTFFQNGTRRSLIQHLDSGDILSLVSEYGGVRFMTGTGGTEVERMRIHSGGDISFRDTSANEAFYWDASTARLGIGTGSSPSSMLHLESASSPVLTIKDTTQGTTLLAFSQNSDSHIGTYSNHPLVFDTNSAERMRISTSGQLIVTGVMPSGGIPLVSLNETSGNSRDGLYLTYTGTTNLGVNVLKISDASKTHLLVRGDGNVGIGTTSPSEKLEVKDGSIRTTTLNSFSNLISGRASVPNVSGYNIGGLLFQAYRTGTTYATGAAIYSYSDGGAWTSTSVPSYLSFHTAAVGAVNTTERMTIDSSGRVGINRVPPAGALSLEVMAPTGYSLGAGFHSLVAQSTIEFKDINTTANYKVRIGSETDDLVMFAGGSLRMRIDSSGNVGIGVSPDEIFHIKATNAPTIRIESGDASGASGEIIGEVDFWGNDFSGTGRDSRAFVRAEYEDAFARAALVFGSGDYNSTATERMRITSGGDVLFGTQGTPDGTTYYGSGFIPVSTDKVQLRMASSSTVAGSLLTFHNPNGTVGNITITGTSTAYNTSSDYRLKENVVPMEGALDRVDALKPSRFNFIADADKTVDGFLAHEVAEVVPEAISGEKDAVDEEGNAIYQGIDQSKLVPLLVGAIQELRAEIETLKSQINN